MTNYSPYRLKVLLSSIGCLIVLLVVAILSSQASLGNTVIAAEETSTLKVAVLSDSHYFPSSMIGAGQDYTAALNSDRKMLTESGAVLDKALFQLLEDKPDVLLIAGDLTKDGELEAHKGVAEKLNNFKAILKANNVHTQVVVINGNHDINNPSAMDYSTGKALSAKRTSPTQFKQIYADLGYNQAIAHFNPKGSNQAGQLSYVVRPKTGYTIIAVDSCKYSSDSTTSGNNLQETGGAISLDLQAWIEIQTKAANTRNDVVIMVQHHGVVPHFEKEDGLMKDYLIDNYLDTSEKLADYGVKYVFTGHMHANDIAQYTSKKGNTIYDVETGSLVTYPSPYRICTLSRDLKLTSTDYSMDIVTKNITSIVMQDPISGKIIEIDDLLNYGKTASQLSSKIGVSLIDMFVSDYITGIKQNGILSFVEENLLGAKLTEESLESLIGGFLVEPMVMEIDALGSKMEIIISFSAEQGYDGLKKVIVVETMSSQVYISMSNLLNAIRSMTDQLDVALLDNDSTIDGILFRLVDALFNYKSMGGENTLGELINHVWQSHLAGDEKLDEWAVNAIANFENQDGIDDLINNLAITEIAAILDDLAIDIYIDIDNLVSKGNGGLASIVKNQFVSMFGSNLKSTIDGTGFGMDGLIGALLPTLLTPDTITSFNLLLHDTLHTMGTDTNFLDDNNAEIRYTTTKAVNASYSNSNSKDIGINIDNIIGYTTLIILGLLILKALLTVLITKSKVRAK